jgi:hypothetical protein
MLFLKLGDFVRKYLLEQEMRQTKVALAVDWAAGLGKI